MDMHSTVTRKTVLQTLSSVPLLGSSLAAAKAANVEPASPGRVTFRYMGTAAWEIRDDSYVILIDPYVSRINGPAPPGVSAYQPTNGDSRPIYGWDDVPTPDAAAVASHVPRADLILVTHAHYDHILDVPAIALRTHALVIGHESVQNILRAYGVPEEQLLTVRGGEDYDFGQLSVKVIPSIHSALDHKHYYSSAIAPAGMTAPLTLRQIHPEGGTLAYLIRLPNCQILAFGSMNYVEREIQGLKPDVLIAGAGTSRKEIYDYSGRLMRTLSFPALVLPTHWDNFLAPFNASQQKQIDALQSFAREIKAASPDTRVVVPEYFESFQ
jgi:L-ascorbate metabolism protein UlaG (beta-lactamase superfamily)